jgi:gentisate 1,2-dioxygenase
MSATETMSTTASNAADTDALLRKLPAEHVEPLWTVMKAMVTARPSPKADVALWKYKDLRPLLLEAGRVVPTEQAERRVLMLINPALSMESSSFLLDTVQYCTWNSKLIRVSAIHRSPVHDRLDLRGITTD